VVGDSVAGGLAGFAHGRRVRSVGDPERTAPVSAQEVLDPFHGLVVRENGPQGGQFTSDEFNVGAGSLVLDEGKTIAQGSARGRGMDRAAAHLHDDGLQEADSARPGADAPPRAPGIEQRRRCDFTGPTQGTVARGSGVRHCPRPRAR